MSSLLWTQHSGSGARTQMAYRTGQSWGGNKGTPPQWAGLPWRGLKGNLIEAKNIYLGGLKIRKGTFSACGSPLHSPCPLLCAPLHILHASEHTYLQLLPVSQCFVYVCLFTPEAKQRPYYADYSPLRLSIHTLCTSHYLDLFITIIICINVFTMSIEHYNQPRVIVLNWRKTTRSLWSVHKIK